MSENLVSSNHQYAHAVGYDLGPASNLVQAELLNGFTRSLKLACGNAIDTQIAFIVDKLTPEAKQILIKFGEAARDE